MKMRLKDKQKSIRLRRQGKTYSEIMSLIPNLPKSTLSGWLKNVNLTKEEKERLFENIKKKNNSSRLKGFLTRRRKIKEGNRIIVFEAKKEFPKLSKDPFFLIGLALYWAEGNKKPPNFQFTNSDPIMIRAIIKWLKRFCGISKKEIKIRLFIHKIYAHENCKKFWSQITGLSLSQFQKTIYKLTQHKIKKNPDYKGCV